MLLFFSFPMRGILLLAKK